MKKNVKHPTSLLLVDDEPIILNTLGSGLKSLGYHVTACDTPDEALNSYQQYIPDLVILDYRMPNMNGVELARALIDIEQRPIIMLSAYSDVPMVREAISAGITAYLVKPVEAERLAPSIEAALARFSEISALMKQGANIQAGVESHRLISTAVGIVMAQTLQTQDLAFESLRKMARDQRCSLRDLAFDLVDSTSMANSILTQLKRNK